MVTTAAIVYHEKAGNGRGEAIAFQLKTYLNQKVSWKIIGPLKTRFGGDAEKNITPFWAPKADLMIVVGGDGTLREVVSGLNAWTGTTRVGLIPMGNANVIARELNIPLDIEGAMANVVYGKKTLLDVGWVQHRDKERQLFLSMIEIGSGARIVHKVHAMRNSALETLYKKWSDGLYLMAGGTSLFEKKSGLFSVTVDDKKRYPRLRAMVISNTRAYAKNWSFTPLASMNNGILNFYARERDDSIARLGAFLTARRKKRQHNHDAVNGKGHRFFIESNRSPLFVQMDGDPISFSQSLSVEIKPNYFSMICP